MRMAAMGRCFKLRSSTLGAQGEKEGNGTDVSDSGNSKAEYNYIEPCPVTDLLWVEGAVDGDRRL
jgi:hypothetical protein